MFKTYDLFDHRNINDLVPEIVYYYLFKGLSLTAIEQKLFKTEDYHGWLSKTFLNYYGIDTDKLSVHHPFDLKGKVEKWQYISFNS